MRGVLLDLDGVLYVGEEPVPGAAATVAWLVEEGVRFRYLTNTTSRPRRAIVERLAAMGVSAEEDQILTPAVAAVAWLRGHGLTRPALFVPDATASEFAALQPPSDGSSGAASGSAEPDAVVVGDLGGRWDFVVLNRAFRLLMGEGAPALVALGLTRYWRAEDGLRLDAGPFVRALEYAARRDAVVLGKPDPAFYATAVESLGFDAGEVVMVGDDVVGDVGGAQSAGLAGMLVRTGKFTPADLDTDVRPDAVLGSIADLPDWWADQRRA